MNKPALQKKRLYTLKDYRAIDAINSRYTFAQVCYFFETIFMLLKSNNILYTGHVQLKKNVKFIEIILTLVNSPLLVHKVKKSYENRPGKPDKEFSEQAKTNLLKSELFAHLDWISMVIKWKEVSLVTLLDDYYSNFPFKPGIQVSKTFSSTY